jgi:Family of unknown function (DUF6022)
VYDVRQKEFCLTTLAITPPRFNNEDIAAVCTAADDWIASHWQTILNANSRRLTEAFVRAGDKAYGTYLGLLLRPVMRALAEADLAVYPRLPGSFPDSREWGNGDESEQQRWFWSSVTRLGDDHRLGTIVTVVHHDHQRFRLPYRPRVFGIDAVGIDAVEAALCRHSADFAAAAPFRLVQACGTTSQESRELS